MYKYILETIAENASWKRPLLSDENYPIDSFISLNGVNWRIISKQIKN